MKFKKGDLIISCSEQYDSKHKHCDYSLANLDISTNEDVMVFCLEYNEKTWMDIDRKPNLDTVSRCKKCKYGLRMGVDKCLANLKYEELK